MTKARPSLGSMAWRRLAARTVRKATSCHWCGSPASPTNPFEADHLIPVSKGGAELDPANVVAACRNCNRSRGTRSPTEWQQGKEPTPRTAYNAKPPATSLPPMLTGDYTRRPGYAFPAHLHVHPSGDVMIVGDMNHATHWAGEGCPPTCTLPKPATHP